MEYNTQEILHGISSGDIQILRFVYQNYLPMTIDLVLKNSGTQEDAKDVFHEGLTIIFEKLQDSSIVIRSTFKSYFYGVCRNLWLMHLRKRKNDQAMLANTQNFDLLVPDSHEDLLDHHRYNLMRQHFKELGEDCQKILTDFFKGVSLKEIAVSMGFSDKYAKKRKHLCQKKLIEAVERDPSFAELLAR